MSYLRLSDSSWYAYWWDDHVTHKHQERLVCKYIGSEKETKLVYLRVKRFLVTPDWRLWNSGGIELEFTEKEKEDILGAMKKWIDRVDIKWGRYKQRKKKNVH